MINTPAVVRPVPTPLDVFATPSSPWVDVDGKPSQLGMDHSIDAAPLTAAEHLKAVLRCKEFLTTAAQTVTAHRLAASSRYPEEFMVALIAGASIYGSESDLLRELEPQRADAVGLYPQLRQLCAEVWGWLLPVRSPSRDQLRGVRDAVAREGLLPAVCRDFTVASLRLANELGALLPTPRASLTDIHMYNQLIGDGTQTKAYSKVKEVPHPRTGEPEIHGSRASKLPPRIQRKTTDMSIDGKPHSRGINTVHIGTLTPVGYVLLGFRQTEGGESPVVVDLLDELLALLPDGAAHAVNYDRVINIWHASYLLSRYALPVIGKGIADGGPTPPYIKDTRKEIASRTKHAANARTKEINKRAKAARVKPRRLDPAEQQQIEEDILRALLGQGDLGLEPGVTVRTNSRGVPELIHSKHADLGTASHRIGDSGLCEHRLVVDDNTLTEVSIDGAKIQYLEVSRARAHRGRDGHTIEAEWVIPCAHGNFVHREEWTPNGRRGPNPAGASRATALDLVRLIPQLDPRWRVLAGQRNLTESWHKWYKDNLLPSRRASSPDADQQLIAYLGSALAFNVKQWDRDRKRLEHLAKAGEAA
jgi:hypothetical protein